MKEDKRSWQDTKYFTLGGKITLRFPKLQKKQKVQF